MAMEPKNPYLGNEGRFLSKSICAACRGNVKFPKCATLLSSGNLASDLTFPKFPAFIAEDAMAIHVSVVYYQTKASFMNSPII